MGVLLFNFVDYLKENWWIGLAVAGGLLLVLVIVWIACGVSKSKWKKRALKAEADRVQNYTVANPVATAPQETAVSSQVTAEEQAAEKEQASSECSATEKEQACPECAAQEQEEAEQEVEQDSEEQEAESDLSDENAEEPADEASAETAVAPEPVVKTPKPKTDAPVKFMVMYDRPKNSWVIKKEGVERVVRRVATKEEAMRAAKELTKKYDANLMVKKKDGRFQKTK